MDEDELKRIEALCSEAMREDWILDVDEIMVEDDPDAPRGYPSQSAILSGRGDAIRFAFESRTALPALCRALREARDDLFEARQALLREGMERDAARAEAERLRHGVPIEGDFVCPEGQRAVEAESLLREALSADEYSVAELRDYFNRVDAFLATPRPALAQTDRSKP